MNILGRLAGGLLIFVGLGWLATLAGLSPFGGRSANQFTAQPVTTTAPLTAGSVPTARTIAGSTNQTVVGQTSNGQTVVAPAGTVEADPRNAAAPTPSPSTVPLSTTTTTTTVASPAPTTTVAPVTPPAPAAPAAPVPAGW